MSDNSRIVKARITALPKTFTDPMPEIIATLEDGSEHKVFSYYPDEISFTESEFIGLTIREAVNLKYKKDIAYLKS